MPTGLFTVVSPHETSLPPMDEIQYTDENGELQGGWWIAAGEAPQPLSVLVAVHTTDEQLDIMAADESGKWLYLGDIDDGKEAEA